MAHTVETAITLMSKERVIDDGKLTNDVSNLSLITVMTFLLCRCLSDDVAR